MVIFLELGDGKSIYIYIIQLRFFCLGQWSCLKCTLENTVSNIACEVCGNSPFPKLEKSDSHSDGGNLPLSSSSKAVMPLNTKKSNGILNILHDLRAVAAKFIADKPNGNSRTQHVHDAIVNDLNQLTRTETLPAMSQMESEEKGESSSISNTDVKEPDDTQSHPKLYKRQTSINSVDVRKGQEQEAVTKWQEIVNICKEVYICI